jgi:hypothetical protein
VQWLTGLRAGFLLALNRKTNAAALYRELLESEPTHVPGLITVLSDCVERNAPDDAIRVATRALGVDDRHFMALQTLGWAYLAMGNHAAARPIVAKARRVFDAQGLGNVSREIKGAAQWLSRRSINESDCEELDDWRCWADSYLANQTEDGSAG